MNLAVVIALSFLAGVVVTLAACHVFIKIAFWIDRQNRHG